MTSGLRSPAPPADSCVDVAAVADSAIVRIDPLTTPRRLLAELPLSATQAATVLGARARIRAILNGEDDRLLVVVGPCSAHDVDAVRDYARRVAALTAGWEDALFPVLRVYFEKPRTTIGWTGLLNDPHLDGSGDVDAGLRLSRTLLLAVLSLGLPTGCELLDPLVARYVVDTVCWAAIGARTSESQIHRRLASGLPMPVGFKNRTDGDVQVAVDAVRAAAAPHSFAAIDHHGSPAVLHTRGNGDCHVILRGGRLGPNHGGGALRATRGRLRAAGLRERVVIDLSHGNSGKDPHRQPLVAAEVAAMIAAGEGAIAGVMLESFLVSGRQDVSSAPMRYGQSITDGCLGFAATAEVLEELTRAVRERRRHSTATVSPTATRPGATTVP